jgi:hypothetical protein
MKATKIRATNQVVLIFLSAVAMLAAAQSSTENRGLAQETEVRGYWVDPSTGLMWAGKDNGKDVNWQEATKHCGNLRLAGYSDWRLACISHRRSFQGVLVKQISLGGCFSGDGVGR